jgi:Family of unknown function (DUF5317)
MTFTVLALVVGAAIGHLTGGRLRHVAGHPLRAWSLLVAGFLLQAATTRLDLGLIGTVTLLAGYVCLLAFALVNRALIGVGVVVVGLAANAIVISANGGMPVRGRAVVAAHIAAGSELSGLDYGHLHHRESGGDRLRSLGDIVPVPQIHQVLSFGDLVLAVGVADVVVHLFRPRRRPRRGAPSVEISLQRLRAGNAGNAADGFLSDLYARFDRQAAGQPFDVVPEVAAVSSEGHHMPQFAVASPPADGFR